MTGSPSFLIIQTAFIGDVVLATALVEKLHSQYPEAPIDFLLRKGNEGLLKNHPLIRNVLVWDKKKGKLKNLFQIIRQVRGKRYTHLINVHRFASSGLITFFSGAKEKIGFDKNPLSFCYTKKVVHTIAPGTHEVERNQSLIGSLTDKNAVRPRLYPSAEDFKVVRAYREPEEVPYLCLAPTSVWFTKQFPVGKWIEFLDQLREDYRVFLLGGPGDREVCESIRQGTTHAGVINLCGSLSFLESAALMQGAAMNFANDSAPVHLASSVNAPMTAIFCSTVPEFGFGPLSDKHFIIQSPEKLPCRPCGLHGHKACPEGHFHCATTITAGQMVGVLKL